MRHRKATFCAGRCRIRVPHNEQPRASLVRMCNYWYTLELYNLHREVPAHRTANVINFRGFHKERVAVEVGRMDDSTRCDHVKNFQ